jgi:hypothetical protein
MPGRILTTVLLAMGAFCCPFHCLHHQADSVAFFVDATAPSRHVLPPSPPAEQNESGCICRGAFFIEAPTLTPIEQLHWCPLVQDCIQVADAFELEVPGAFISPADHQWRVPLSGKALRAWHASFLF